MHQICFSSIFNRLHVDLMVAIDRMVSKPIWSIEVRRIDHSLCDSTVWSVFQVISMMFAIQTMLGLKLKSGIFTMVRLCLSPISVQMYADTMFIQRRTSLFLLNSLGYGFVERCDLQFAQFSHANFDFT